MKILLTPTSLLIRVALLFLLVVLIIWIVWTLKSNLDDDIERHRAAALTAFETGRHEEALANIKLAIQTSRFLPERSALVVEVYDDAGLYYYALGDFKQSVRHQAVAVLFASENSKLQAMLPVYVERLGWAWQKFRPGSDFSFIKTNPHRLLDEPDVALFDELRIREHFHPRLN